MFMPVLTRVTCFRAWSLDHNPMFMPVLTRVTCFRAWSPDHNPMFMPVLTRVTCFRAWSLDHNPLFMPVLTRVTCFRACSLDHNPLFISCKGGAQRLMKKSRKKPERNGYFRKRMFTDVQRKDIIVKDALRGVSLFPAPHLQVCPHLVCGVQQPCCRGWS